MVIKKKPAPARKPSAARPSKPATKPERLVIEADTEIVPVEFTQQLLDRLTPPTDAESRAFASQCSDARAAELGARTVARNVANDARRALKRGERMLGKYPGLIKYTLRRLAFLAQRVRELERKMAAQAGGRATGPSVPATEKALRAARTELVDALDDVLEGNEKYAEDLAEVRGDTNTTDGLISSAAEAIALAARVLEDEDESLQVLAREHGLTASLAEHARIAAQSLRNAIDYKPDDTRAGDAPEVNLAEGRVLFELRMLKRALDRAHARNNVVERYVPSSALRSALQGGGHQPPKAAKPIPAATTPAAP